MTDYEPYVADPAEPAPRQALTRARPLLVTLIIAIVIAGGAFRLFEDRAEQDPSLEIPADEIVEPEDEPATGPEDEPAPEPGDDPVIEPGTDADEGDPAA